jgi:hypothetical protein
VSAYLRQNARPLAFALAFSVLLHAAFLWLPGLSLPRARTNSSLLTVRMEPSGKQRVVEARPEVKPAVATVTPPVSPAPKSVTPAPIALIPEKPQVTTAQINVVKEAVSSVTAAGASAVPSAAPAVAAEQAMPATDNDPNRTKQGVKQLPLHAHLRFAAYLAESSLSIGSLYQELDIKEGRYTIQAELEKAGLGSWFNSTQLTQLSKGTLLPNGDLAPETFVEEATDAHGAHHRYEADFDWNAMQLRFAGGNGSAVQPGTLDMLGLLYQLSQLSLNREIFRLAVTDGTRLEYIRLEVGAEEEIETPMGKLRARHFHQMPEQDPPWMDIWLSSDYHMLPVRFQKTGSDGRITEKYVIKEIVVSDDQPAN